MLVTWLLRGLKVAFTSYHIISDSNLDIPSQVNFSERCPHGPWYRRPVTASIRGSVLFCSGAQHPIHTHTHTLPARSQLSVFSLAAETQTASEG